MTFTDTQQFIPASAIRDSSNVPCDRPGRELRLPQVPDGDIRPSPSMDPQLEAARVVGYLPGLGSCIGREE